MASYIEIDICASTYRHSYTMNFSFFSPTICLTRGRMSRLDSLAHTECVSLFSKISPRGFTIKFSYSISHAMHTPKIVFHCCSTFTQQLTSRFSKSRASPIFFIIKLTQSEFINRCEEFSFVIFIHLLSERILSVLRCPTTRRKGVGGN